MSYMKRLDKAFNGAPILPIDYHSKYVFFSDCHRGTGNNNDNFLKNNNCYLAALQYYYQTDFCYIEVGDGDELWENRKINQIIEIHGDIFSQLLRFHKEERLYMLYGNHDMIKKNHSLLFRDLKFHEGLILSSQFSDISLRITHGHQADFLNSVLWRLARFLVRHLWAPLEFFGVSDPTSAAKNNTKKVRLEKRYLSYAKNSHCLLLTGHTHRPTLGTTSSPYLNCGSCVHPKCITCIELCSFKLNLVKWCSTTAQNEYFNILYRQNPPGYPVYIKREVLASESLFSYEFDMEN